MMLFRWNGICLSVDRSYRWNGTLIALRTIAAIESKSLRNWLLFLRFHFSTWNARNFNSRNSSATVQSGDWVLFASIIAAHKSNIDKSTASGYIIFGIIIIITTSGTPCNYFTTYLSYWAIPVFANVCLLPTRLNTLLIIERGSTDSLTIFQLGRIDGRRRFGLN